MSTSAHQKLAQRLTHIIIKLNQGEVLVPERLAEEFGVDVRTIQRDLNERFAFLSLERREGGYALDAACLGRFNAQDVRRFAALAGVRGLFPSLSDDFLREILDTRMQTTWLVKGQNFESLEPKRTDFQLLEQAIREQRVLSFEYDKQGRYRPYERLEPYKLVNHDGIWYLAARHQGRLKAFSFGKISRLHLWPERFEPDAEVMRTLVEEDDIWLNPDKVEVVLQIDREVEAYFRRRKLLANQQLVKQLDDGGLIVSCKVAHPNQILPSVRYWLPHVRIISPKHYQTELEQGLQLYLQQAA